MCWVAWDNRCGQAHANIKQYLQVLCLHAHRPLSLPHAWKDNAHAASGFPHIRPRCYLPASLRSCRRTLSFTHALLNGRYAATLE